MVACLVLQTDASLLGWGAVMNDSKTGGIWNYDEKENHINYLELLAVFYALKAFQCQLPSLQLLSRLSSIQTTFSEICIFKSKFLNSGFFELQNN
jgi:hypothetical protein